MGGILKGLSPHTDLTRRYRRATVFAVVLIAGAAMAAMLWRGPAILLDLSGLAASLWCF
jgi:hypothetical protein